MAEKKSTDWQGMKDLYMYGEVNEDGNYVPVTNIEIARRFGITPQSLSIRSVSEEWATERKLFQENLERRKREKRVETLADEAAGFDARVLKVAKAGMTHIEKYFEQAKHEYQESGKPIAVSTLERLSRCVERYQKVGRLALGENTNNVQSSTETWLDLYDALEEVG